MLDGDPYKRTRNILMGLLMSIARTILNTALVLAIALSATQVAFASIGGKEETDYCLPTGISTRLITTEDKEGHRITAMNASEPCPLVDLNVPAEMLAHILYFLPNPSDRKTVRLVSKHLRAVINTTSSFYISPYAPSIAIHGSEIYGPFAKLRGTLHLIDGRITPEIVEVRAPQPSEGGCNKLLKQALTPMALT